MTNFIAVLTGTLAVYVALICLVTFNPKITKRLIGIAAAVALVFGFILYGLCFSSVSSSLALAVSQTCYAVFCLFVGENSLEALSDTPLLQSVLIQSALYALSFLGLFATAGAAISSIGANYLRRIRLYLLRKKPLAIFNTLTADTVDFAQELLQKGYAPVFAVENPDPTLEKTAQNAGCVILSGSAALEATPAFLRSIGAAKGSRKISLFCIADDPFVNSEYAVAFMAAAKCRDISPEQTSLTVFSEEEDLQDLYLNSSDSYGYGNVQRLNPSLLAARLLIQTAPLWDNMSFDDTGAATEDFHALVVGCGKVGQAVLKQLVMNGQFYGSHFSLAVFDPNYEAITGKLRYECSQVFDRYDITAYPHDGRSRQMYDYLSSHLEKLKYVVVCTGNDLLNTQIARELNAFFHHRGSNLTVHICSRRGLRHVDRSRERCQSVYTYSVLCADDIDKKAILLNHGYCGNSLTPAQNWAQCNYFNRMSSRASADYSPAFLKMAGCKDHIPTENWVSGQLLENMAISEHERWCAFHYCMGFRPMTEEEFAGRCKIYQQEKEADPATRYRIGKDIPARVHACLIPWEALDQLSARENAVTGGTVDYKAMDRNNVLMLPKLLLAEKD